MNLHANGDNAYTNGDKAQHNVKNSSTGFPVQIVEPIVVDCGHENESDCTAACRETHFVLNEKGLEAILLREDVKDKKVCVLSIVGAFRKGKSFLLDFFVRYLQIQNPNWLSAEEERISGFKWRGGSEKETEGIWIWNEPFFVKAKVFEEMQSECNVKSSGEPESPRRKQSNLQQNSSTPDSRGSSNSASPQGAATEVEEEVCVLLMDVQGTFDSSSTIRACATIFALTAMLSSVQIYNVSQNIQEDDLQHLQVFTEYGRVALSEDADTKPFQNLVMLVRDWSYPYEAQYGFEGGSTILERRLAITDRQHPELQQLRRYLRECFVSLRCFLMPHPGLQVATSPTFDGSLSQIGGEFRESLSQFVPQLVGPQHVGAHLKRVAHQEILATELMTYFRSYISIFQTEELPQPKTMYEATAEANNQAAEALGVDAYRKHMDLLCGAGRPYAASDLLSKQHIEAREIAVRTFRERRKMGGPHFSQRYEAVLIDDIETLRGEFEKANESKNLFRVARTPITLLFVLLCSNLIDNVVEFIGLIAVDSMLDAFGWILLSSIGIWSYAKYAGRFSEAVLAIDAFATIIYDQLQAWLNQPDSPALIAMRAFGEQLQGGVNKTLADAGQTESNNAQRKVSLSPTPPLTIPASIAAKPATSASTSASNANVQPSSAVYKRSLSKKEQ